MLHRRALFAVPAVLALAAACSAPVQPRTDGSHPRYDAATFYATTAYQGASFSHDGASLLVTSDESGIFNAYSVDLATGAWRALTHSTSNAISGISWFPGDSRFLYTADQGGNELHHLFVGLADGGAHDLTPGAKTKARFAGWTHDQQSFFVLTNERDPEYFDAWRYRADDFSRELLFRNPGGYDLSAVSRDGAWVALLKVHDNANSDVHVARTTAPADLVHLTPHEGSVSYGIETFSPDGGTLYLTSDEGREFSAVWSHDLATKARTRVLAADWDVTSYDFSEDGRWISTAINADARTVVRVFEAKGGREVALPRVPAGDITGVAFERGGQRLAFYVNGDRSPSNLHLVDLATGSQQRLTHALPPAIEEAALVEAEVIRYPSFDGLPIPALLYRPHSASADARVPALLWIHGGPGGQSRGGYNATIQHLVNHGYAVLAVNNRGSSGYGKTFYHLDDRRHGDVDLADCVAARRWLESLDWVDGTRVGIMGGSYGGYMVCAALAFEPQAFDCGLDIFGVTNWIRTLESIPPWWAGIRASLHSEVGDPATDRARLEARSPLLHASNIVKPLLVIQGKNDPRVLEAESREIAAAVRANGVPVEFVLFPDEGHGFRSKANRITASETYLAFLERHLRGVPAE
jgi:dipeptidyl aminopeptidase/acylaminoacyl peptidase